MSADNRILVTKWDDGFRIGHGSASNPLPSTCNTLYDQARHVIFFGEDPKVYPDSDQAWKAAYELEESIGYVEYGIDDPDCTHYDLEEEYTTYKSRGSYPKMSLADAWNIEQLYWIDFGNEINYKIRKCLDSKIL